MTLKVLLVLLGAIGAALSPVSELKRAGRWNWLAVASLTIILLSAIALVLQIAIEHQQQLSKAEIERNWELYSERKLLALGIALYPVDPTTPDWNTILNSYTIQINDPRLSVSAAEQSQLVWGGTAEVQMKDGYRGKLYGIFRTGTETQIGPIRSYKPKLEAFLGTEAYSEPYNASIMEDIKRDLSEGNTADVELFTADRLPYEKMPQLFTYITVKELYPSRQDLTIKDLRDVTLRIDLHRSKTPADRFIFAPIFICDGVLVVLDAEYSESKDKESVRSYFVSEDNIILSAKSGLIRIKKHMQSEGNKAFTNW